MSRVGARLVQKRVRIAGFRDPPAFKHITACGGPVQHREIVRDEQHRRARLVHQRREQVHDLPLRDRIQCGGRFVGDDQPLAEADLGKHRCDAFRPFGERQIVMQVQRKTDLLRHGHHRIQRGGRILEHHAHVPSAQVGDRCVRRADNLRTTQFDAARHLCGRRQQTHHGAGDHRFAGTGRADQADTFAVGDVQIDIIDDRLAVDGDVQMTYDGAHAASLNAGLVSGSSASRNASPNRFNATTTMVTTRPGHRTAMG